MRPSLTYLAFLFAVVFPSGVGATSLSVEAEHDMGVLHLTGDGVPVDKSKGRTYIHQAALRGYPLAQFHLGLLFYRGEGGERHLPCAKWWLGQAAMADNDTGALAAQALAEIPQRFALPTETRFLLANVVDEKRCLRLPEQAGSNARGEPHNSIETNDSTELSGQPVTVEPSAIGLVQAPEVPVPITFTEIEVTLFARGYEAITHRVVNVLPLLRGYYAQWDTQYAQWQIQQWSVAYERRRGHGAPLLEKPRQFIAERARIAAQKKSTSVPVIDTRPSISLSSIPSTAPLTPPLKQTPLTGNLGGNLAQASPLRYTLQLSSASDPSGLYETAQRYKLTNYMVYPTVRHGRAWHVLVYGEYADIKTAKLAIKTLPVPLQRNQPWPRRLKHVQAELPK